MARLSRTSTIIALACCYLVGGTIQTLSLKVTENILSPGFFSSSDAEGEGTANISQTFIEPDFFFLFNFTHPFGQAFFMFFAESLCLVALGIHRLVRQKATLARPHHPLVYLVPAAADFFASVVQNIGLFLTYASVYQMLRGATVVWIAFLSRIVFKRRYKKIQIWGIVLAMLGLTFVGLSSVIHLGNVEEKTDAPVVYPHQVLGNTMIVMAQVLHAVQGVSEERLLIKYDIPPLQVVGLEGLFGLSLSIMLLALFQVYPTAVWHTHVGGLQVEEHFLTTNASVIETSDTSAFFGVENQEFTSVTVWNHSQTKELLQALEHHVNLSSTSSFSSLSRAGLPAGKKSGDIKDKKALRSLADIPVPFDDIHLVFYQMKSSRKCFLAVLCYVSSGIVYNVAQISIIQLLSAAGTVMLGSLRNITVWLVCILLPFFQETINALQLVGFFLLVGGNILFQRVCWQSLEEFLPQSFFRVCPLLFAEDDNPSSS